MFSFCLSGVVALLLREKWFLLIEEKLSHNASEISITTRIPALFSK